MDEESENGEEGGSSVSKELLLSYVAFVRRAISRRWLLGATIFVVVAGLTVALAALWPRTYHCETRLMADTNDALPVHGGVGGLRAAADVISRQDNLEAIVKETDLVHFSAERRPFILRLKDSVMQKIRGPVDEKDAARAMVWTLADKLVVQGTEGTVTIGADWSDGQSAARLVQAAEENFLESRHVAEISTIAEYIAILEGHAATLRAEVETLAEQIKEIKKDKRSDTLAKKTTQSTTTPDAPGPRRLVARPRPAEPDPEVPRLKVLLEGKQQAIAELEGTRHRRLTDAEAKLDDFKSKYTSAHPIIEDLSQQVAALSHESPQVTSLRAEAHDLETELKRRGAPLPPTTTGGWSFSRTAGGAAAPLPEDIMTLLADGGGDEVDPALGAQLGYAIAKFSTLRSEISEARIDLDTAQAAFKHRYKVITPAEVPTKPIKPKVPVIVGAGLVLSLILSLLSVVGMELRTGRIVERWQVHQIALPVLAELRFPPGNPSSD